ncbi:MAG: DUF3185 family protein [Pseudomonadota bacterium]
MKPRLWQKLVGLLLIAVGVGYIYWGHLEAQGVANQMLEYLTGKPNNDVLQRYIAGTAAIAIGFFLTIHKPR